MIITLKVAETLRQRYAECSTTSKVFNRSRPKMALLYSMSIASTVMYSLQEVFGVPKETGNVIILTGSILLPPKL
jgi:hypothetical protein